MYKKKTINEKKYDQQETPIYHRMTDSRLETDLCRDLTCF